MLTWLPFSSKYGNLTIFSYANATSPGLFMWSAVRGNAFPTPVDNGLTYFAFVRAASDVCTASSNNYVKSNTSVTTVTLPPASLRAVDVLPPTPWAINPSLWQITYVAAVKCSWMWSNAVGFGQMRLLGCRGCCCLLQCHPHYVVVVYVGVVFKLCCYCWS